jgi:IclR family acetate operon transcriptional repressor
MNYAIIWKDFFHIVEGREPAMEEVPKESVQLGGVQSVERALDLLEHLAHTSDWVGVSELSIATGLPAGTVHRLLMTLITREYVIRDRQKRRYAIGPAFRLLADNNSRMPDWPKIAMPYLQELVAVSGETANLAVLERNRAVYVAQAQSMRMVRMFTEIGNRVTLHSTGCGKVLLAFQSDEVIRSILAEIRLPACTDKTITNLERLQEELAQVRQQGYARDDEEMEEGVRCIAVPVYHLKELQGPKGKVVAAMSISGPTSRLDSVCVSVLIAHLQRISGDLSKAMFVPDFPSTDQ